MVFEMRFVRRAYTQLLAHEMKKVVRMLRAFPLEQLDERDTGCGRSARELAEGFIAHLRRLDAIASGADWELPARGPRTRGSILLELEACYLGTYAALDALSPMRLSEVIASPRGLSPWSRARRGELLCTALRHLVRHTRHFSLHLRGECRHTHFGGHDGGSRVPVMHEPEVVGVGA